MAEKSGAGILGDLRLALKRKGMAGLVRDILLHPGNQAIAMYRLSRWLYLRKRVLLAFLVYRLNYFFCGVEIHPDADIGPDFHLDHPIAVLIGRRTKIGRGVRVHSHVAMGAIGMPEENPFLEIKDYVQIYHGALLGGSCTVGEYARIAGGAAVWNKDVPPYSLAVGNPLRIVRIMDQKVDYKEYRGYKYNPADYHGPPPDHDLSKLEERYEFSWMDSESFGKGGQADEGEEEK